MPRTSRPLQVLPIILREVEVTGIVDITPQYATPDSGGRSIGGG